MFFPLFFLPAVLASPLAHVDAVNQIKTTGLKARDSVNKPTYLTAFNYTVLLNPFKTVGGYADEYSIAFYQENGGDSVVCRSQQQISDPNDVVNYPTTLKMSCKKADGTALASPYDSVALSYTYPLRPSGTAGSVSQMVLLTIVPKVPEGYVFFRADIFKDGKFSCTNGGSPPFNCTLAGDAPKLRLEENGSYYINS